MKPKQPKPKKCAWSKCRKMFTPSPFRFNQKTCDNMVCALGYVKDKEEEKEAKDWKLKRKGMKAELLSHSDYSNILQKLINQIARGIDANYSCISSNRTTGQMHGGHLYSVGAHPEIRFNLLNIWKQSAMDNTFKSGNINDYRANIEKIFETASKRIFDLPVNAQPLKLSIVDLQDKIKIAKQIIKEQASGLHIALSQEDRLIIRINLNKRIGIYK